MTKRTDPARQDGETGLDDDALTPAEQADQDDAEFDAAFAEFSGAPDDPPPPDDPPKDRAEGREEEGETEEQGDDDPPETPENEDPEPPSPADGGAPQPNDPWANAPAELRAAWEAAQHEMKSNRGRIAALQRQISELSARTQPARTDAAQGAASETPDGFTDEEWKSLKDDYPEIAAPIEKALMRLEEKSKTLETQLASFDEERRETYYARQESTLASKHADWLDVVRDPRFSTWLADQPAYVQEAAYKNGERIVDGQDAAHVIDLFKLTLEAERTRNQPPPAQEAPRGNSNLAGRRQRRLESAVSVPSRGPQASGGPPDDFETAFDYYARR